jgi:hypothetical protein
MMIAKARLFLLLAALLMLTGVASAPAAFAQEDTARVRVVHASPNAPAVDVYLDGSLVDGLSNVPFFTVSGYLEIPAGERRIQVTPAGAGPDQAVIDASVPFTGGNAYTVAAVGLLENISAEVIEDDLSELEGSEARVTVYHFSPDAPAVDVKLADGTILLDSIDFGSSSSIDVGAGTYDLLVTPAGEAEPVVINLAGTTVEAGNNYDVFAYGTLANIGPALSVNGAPVSEPGTGAPAPAPEPTATPAPEQPAGTAQVSVVHASPDAPAVDIYLNDTAVLTSVPFFTASDYLEVPAGDQRIRIAPAGAPVDDAVIDGVFTFNANEAYTVAAIGTLENIQAVSFEDDLSPTPAGEARVSVFHFSPDAPAVDVKLADGTVLFSNLAFGSGVEGTVPAGTYDIIVTPAGASEPVVIDLPGTTVEAGNLYNVYATNLLESIEPQLKVVNVGATAPAPAPTAAPAPTPHPDTPAVLPETSEGNTQPIGTLALLAVVLLSAGVLVLALRRRIAR